MITFCSFLYGQDAQKLYMNHCAACHGSDGHGKTAMGRAISNLPDLTSPSVGELSDDEIYNIITNGKGVMPSFKELSEADRKALVQYIRTFSK